MKYRIVETDNFGGDYPDEKFAGPPLEKEEADRIAKAFNDAASGPNSPRFWKVEPVGYKLQPGFEP